MRAQCLAGLGRFQEAHAAAEAELRINPGSTKAAELKQKVGEVLRQLAARSAEERQWASSLRPEFLQQIEASTHRYTYRGHPMIKNPFDFALYPLLLWNLKPASVFEIGSFNGASALWMADLLKSYGVASHIWSLDIVKVTAIEREDITFLAGSGRALGEVFPAEMLAGCPRPWLVIDDADHTRDTSIAVLQHFHPHMREGEYIVVEDGLTAEGPKQALTEFLPAHPGAYTIDPAYCDFFGYNATWCINGFLRRNG
ncbi:MAG: cephalosporin hydroxylase [Fimbriimonas ginsengisoli]|uniref:Cephalosporin hydroxylase n=1 Tax=Fimbriimonas ginsengisoli TaxID=1005039 RepID=A0A931LTJ6_FIMGI|nr:cephalosporin hydroxylase [Fimbriimonas ginsengisoli]